MSFETAVRKTRQHDLAALKAALPANSEWPVELYKPYWVFLYTPDGGTSLHTLNRKKDVSELIVRARAAGLQISIVARKPW